MNIQRIGLMAALLVGVPYLLSAQGAGVSGLAGLAHIALRVSDVDREVNFLGKLGFEEAFANTKDGRTLQAFIKVNDRQFIEVYPQDTPADPLGMMHACYESTDLQALSDRYAAEGLKPASYRKAGAGNILFNLDDPDGRITEFTQYMPDSRQMKDAGQHLGAGRVSTQLLGFEMPVRDVNASQKFYEALGFDAKRNGTNVQLSIPANPKLHIELHVAHINDRPQLLFAVKNVRSVSDELRKAGLKVERNNRKQIFVRDPDGNAFVLLETEPLSTRNFK